MSKMEFETLYDVDIQVITDKAVKIDHPELDAPVWIPRSALSMTTDDALDKSGRTISDIEVDKWFVVREGLEALTK